MGRGPCGVTARLGQPSIPVVGALARRRRQRRCRPRCGRRTRTESAERPSSGMGDQAVDHCDELDTQPGAPRTIRRPRRAPPRLRERREAGSRSSETLQDARSNVGPIGAALAPSLGRLRPPVELREPRVIPIGIARPLDARNDVRRELEPLVFWEREYLLEKLSCRVAHANNLPHPPGSRCQPRGNLDPGLVKHRMNRPRATDDGARPAQAPPSIAQSEASSR